MNKRLLSTKKLEAAVLIIASVIISFFFLLGSPAHPWHRSVCGIDSSVFQTVAMMMDKGFMPYRDSFDHKGPFLYILQFIGYKIEPIYGIFYVELVFLTIFICACYKTARLLVNPFVSAVCALLNLSLLFTFFSGGNLTEEYGISLSAVALYVFADYFINEKITCFRLILCGFCFAGALMLRPNLIALWVIFCLAVLIKCIAGKSWKELWYFVLWFVVGIAILMIPIVIWLWANNALSDCWYDYITFNMIYSSSEGGRVSSGGVMEAFMTFFKKPLVSITCVCSLSATIFDKRNRLLNCSYLVYVFANILFACAGGSANNQYGIMLAVMVSYATAAFAACISKLKPGLWINLFVYVVLFAIFVFPDWRNTVQTLPETYYSRNEDHIGEEVNYIIGLIDELTPGGEPISVHGNLDCFYLLADRPHATKYSYQIPIGDVEPAIMADYYAGLQSIRPHVIIGMPGFFDEDMMNFLDKNSYTSQYVASNGITVFSY